MITTDIYNIPPPVSPDSHYKTCSCRLQALALLSRSTGVTGVPPPDAQPWSEWKELPPVPAPGNPAGLGQCWLAAHPGRAGSPGGRQAAAVPGSRTASAGARSPAGTGSPGGTDGTAKEERLENEAPSQTLSSSYNKNTFFLLLKTKEIKRELHLNCPK